MSRGNTQLSYSRAGTNTNILVLVLALVLVLVLAKNIANILEYWVILVYIGLHLFGIPVIFVYIGSPKVARMLPGSWPKVGPRHKNRNGHEKGRRESCEFINRTILHRISVRTTL